MAQVLDGTRSTELDLLLENVEADNTRTFTALLDDASVQDNRNQTSHVAHIPLPQSHGVLRHHATATPSVNSWVWKGAAQHAAFGGAGLDTTAQQSKRERLLAKNRRSQKAYRNRLKVREAIDDLLMPSNV